MPNTINLLYNQSMKKLSFLLLVSLNANAECYQDAFGFVTCIESQSTIDIRDSTNSPKIIENGIYRGNLNNNVLDPNSISNPLGKYGNPLSQDSIFNPLRSQ